jgi:enterochelin esterase-like enzyme
LITETLSYDGGRAVTVYLPATESSAVVFAADGGEVANWGVTLAEAGAEPTVIVGVHGLADETLRLEEYSPGFNEERFSAHEAFVIEDVRDMVRDRFGLSLEPSRTAVFGASAGGEFALAMGLRHPEVFGSILCGSPGAGFQPPATMPGAIPRAYLLGGRQEPFFLNNAVRWADALRKAGADVELVEREGAHESRFWQAEFPRMVAWAFGERRPAHHPIM